MTIASSKSGLARQQGSRHIPAEGEGGLFTQSWFPIVLGSDVGVGQVVGRNFLDGKVVVFRGENGKAVVASAYCPHVGADLSVGRVIGNNVQCAFHHWEYDASGQCVKTGIGDPPPQRACLFVFPTQERFGIIWAFNGTEPLFDLPTFPVPEQGLVMRNYYFETPLNCDPWVFAANTPDMQHLKVVHKIQFGMPDPHDQVEWTPYGMKMSYVGTHQGGVPLSNTSGIIGTSIFFRWGTYDNQWRGTVTGFGLPRPGQHIVFGCNMVQPGPDAEKVLDTAMAISKRTVSEDWDILNTIHYRQGILTKSDKSLTRYLRMVRDFPRAHPSADFIN